MFSPLEKPLSPWWKHGVIIVMVIGFMTLGIITVFTYTNAPPVPATVVNEQGEVLFTKDEINAGQEVFLKYALMEHGTLWGHGAYLGPDYTADSLHRMVLTGQEFLARHYFDRAFADIKPEEQHVVSQELIRQFKLNQYEAETGALNFSPVEEAAYLALVPYWHDYFTKAHTAPGLPANYIKNPEELRNLASYFAWATWATVTNRPDKDYTYTNNWPYDPMAGNLPSSHAYIWSALSLVMLLGGLGLVLVIFGKFNFLGWEGDKHEQQALPPPPSNWTLTPSQWATGKYFLVVSLLFVLQALIGGGLAHYRVEPYGFYGIELITQIFPYNLLRTYHLQMVIFWIATAWVAGGLFLAPWVSGHEPAGQEKGTNRLFYALLLVVAGSLIGEFLGMNNWLGGLWFWLGNQGSEYLDLGRFWQLLLAAALVYWIVLMFRALRPAIAAGGRSGLSALFLYAAVAIPLFYLPALFYGPQSNFAVIDNWRFWIIHLWVEGFFELFATTMVAIMFCSMGIVSTRSATRIVYLDAILFLTGGIIGTGHHWYFTGQGVLNMALSASFSALEVVPLTLLTVEASGFIHLRRRNKLADGSDMASRQKWAIYFLIAVGVWNFVGAGVFGFLINTPIVSYFEMGTTLTANHAHGAMFGVFGMLALGILVFSMRAMQSDQAWAHTEKYVRVGYWGLNIGLALMIILDLFPAGVLQLWDVLQHGYWHARSEEFLMSGLFHTMEWARIAGDVVFLVFGVLPMLLFTVFSYLKRDYGR